MIIKENVKNFEKMGLGMFVHFGLYSLYGKGEWAFYHLASDDAEKARYRALAGEFDPEKGWAKKLVATAKRAGCKYITLTTRHHDGFSLYDTCGLSDFDVMHGAAGRDLVREFVDACNEAGVVPFFYHTYLDWYVPEYESDFPAYLAYLRRSVELLCTRYGKIGGFWFDGKWNKRDADWEEDALYGMIRRYQPDAIIVNNTGIGAEGELGHIELDSVTFERSKPVKLNMEKAPKYVASEMCQVFGSHWGYAKEDFRFKSMKEIIEDYCTCRRFGGNYLLNVGPLPDGSIRPIEQAMFDLLGEWSEPIREALYLPRPADAEITNKEKDFLLAGDGCYYLFAFGLPMKGSANVVKYMADPEYSDVFSIRERVKAAYWLHSGRELAFEQEGDRVVLHTVPFRYGEQRVVAVAKIEVE